MNNNFQTSGLIHKYPQKAIEHGFFLVTSFCKKNSNNRWASEEFDHKINAPMKNRATPNTIEYKITHSDQIKDNIKRINVKIRPLPTNPTIQPSAHLSGHSEASVLPNTKTSHPQDPMSTAPNTPRSRREFSRSTPHNAIQSFPTPRSHPRDRLSPEPRGQRTENWMDVKRNTCTFASRQKLHKGAR